MIEISLALINSIRDPILLLITVVIGSLYYLLNQKEKYHNAAYTGLCEDIKKNSENLANCNVTIAKLVTLVEVLVHGRR